MFLIETDEERRLILERRLRQDRATIERRAPEMRRKYWEGKRRAAGN